MISCNEATKGLRLSQLILRMRRTREGGIRHDGRIAVDRHLDPLEEGDCKEIFA